MERKNPDEPNSWSFEQLGGMVLKDGKSHRPDVMDVWMDRREALRVIRSLAHQLTDEVYSANEEDFMHFAFVGELTEE